MQNQKVKKTRLGSTGTKHWNYQHGNETLAAKKQRSERSLRLHYLSEIGHQLSFMNGRRLPGRKPVNFVTLDCNNKDHLVYVINIINKVN
ncbi:hypothetical protein MCEMIHM37_00929 [Candidatus Methylopumilus planktonicus]